MMGEAELKMGFPDAKSAENATKALKGEEELGKRVEAKVSRSGKTLSIKVKGRDVVALRATLNAFLRYLQVMEGIEER